MRQTCKTMFSILTGMALLTFGLYNIHSRCSISEGGVLGTTLLLHHWFHISPSISGPFLDITFFSIGVFVLGKGFLFHSLFASLCFSFWYALFEHIGPLLPDLSNHLFAAAVLGGLFIGAGTGLAVRTGTAAGGDDALVLILNKLFGFRVSLVYLFSDITILLLSLSYIPLQDIVWSLLSVTISSKVVEFFHDI